MFGRKTQPLFAPDESGGGGLPEGGLGDDFSGAQHNEPVDQLGSDIDLSQPYIAITGDDGQEVTLTGQEVIDRLGRVSDFEGTIKDLQAKLEASKTQLPAVQSHPVYQPPVQYPGQGEPTLDQQAAQALEDFANGDISAIPRVMQIMKQTAVEAARAETSAGFNSYSREQAFSEKYPEAQSLLGDSEFSKFAQANRHIYQDGVQAAIAYLGDRRTASMQKEIETLKAQLATAAKTGRAEGERQTLQEIKARGGIRLLQGGNAGPRGQAKTEIPKFSSHEDAASGMKEMLMKMRGVNALD